MRSRTGFARREFKSGASLLLILLLLLSLDTPAWSFSIPFLHRKKPAVENLPPATKITPGLINPHESTPAQPGGSDTGVMAQPGPLPAEKAPPNPIQQLVDRGVFPTDAATRTQPVTRAELADILVKTLKHNPTLVSEFPFYRDVPKTYWAYGPIEVARTKKLMTFPRGHGFYNPDKAATYGLVYIAMSNAMTGPPPTSEEVNHLLEGFKNWTDLPVNLQPAVAKLARVRVFGNQTELLRPQDPVTMEGLAPLMVYLMHLVEQRSPLIEETTVANPILPGGVALTVSPSTAIFESQLSVGASVSFALVYAADPLPKGTLLRGTVRSSGEAHTYAVELTEAETPEGQNFQTSAPLTIFFPPKQKLAFIVPGETFNTTTQTPANAVTPSANPPGFTPKSTPGLGPNPPGVPSAPGSTSIPSFSPPQPVKPVSVPAKPNARP